MHIWERLDRFLCNASFDNLFSFAGSDHRPIEIFLSSSQYRNKRRYKKSFKFEEFWTKYEECTNLIETNGIWDNSRPSSLNNNLLSCSDALGKWGREVNSTLKTESKPAKNAPKEAYDNFPIINYEAIHNLEFELNKLLE